MPKDANGLTPKQARFVQEYLVDLNATQAAIRAGYSQKTAHVIGQENLKKPIIAAAVEKAKQKRAQRTEIDQDWVLKNIRTVVERCIAEGEDFDAAAVLRGSELAGRHLGMFTDNLNLSGKVGKLDDKPPSEEQWVEQYGAHTAPTNGAGKSPH